MPVVTIALPEEEIRRFAAQRRSPAIEDEHVTFLVKAPGKRRVAISGDLVGWSWNALPLQRVFDDVWAVTIRLPRDSRMEYKFVLDGEWMMDPWNPHRADNGVGGLNSVLTMPDFLPVPELAERPGTLRGRLDRFRIPSAALHGDFELHVWLPPGFEEREPGTRYPTLYVHDGGEYVRRVGLHRIAENLLEDGRLVPMILVFVTPRERMREYIFSASWCSFMALELVPFIDNAYPTHREAAFRGSLGASLGGLAALTLVATLPDLFGFAACHSSSVQIHRGKVIRWFEALPRREVRIYLDCGTFEGHIGLNREFRQVLQSKGYPLRYLEHHEGHTWTNWRRHAKDALLAFGGRQDALVAGDGDEPSSGGTFRTWAR